jgi:hypothetical protein
MAWFGHEGCAKLRPVNAMCVIDWGLVAAWIGSLAAVGLVIAAVYGFEDWKRQFFKRRDHDLARDLVHAIKDSEVKFHQLRTTDGLFTDGDLAFASPRPGDVPGQAEHRQMYARYRSRTQHVVSARMRRTTLAIEASALWEPNYAIPLCDLVNSLAPLEDRVAAEAMNFVESLVPKSKVTVNQEVLFAPDDVKDDDRILDEYREITGKIIKHLRPKLQML